MKTQTQLQQIANEKSLNKIFRNLDENGYVLTYSIIIKLGNGMLLEMERNTRRELKCFEEII